jgi:hypothetical protein
MKGASEKVRLKAQMLAGESIATPFHHLPSLFFLSFNYPMSAAQKKALGRLAKP